MKKFSIFMIAALALVACNKEQNAVVDQPAEADQTPVSFGAYVNRATTKAGMTSPDLVIGDDNGETTNGLKYNLKGSVGFGVFAYYTNADNYDQSYTPNFMFNQHVKWVTANSGTGAVNHWDYSPVKYWPNEFGKNAQSDDADKISFFAYGPYVHVNPASGKVNGTGIPNDYHEGDNGKTDYGIVGTKRNNAAGDPMIQYIVTPYLDKQVDLVWGTASSDSWSLKLENNNDQNLTQTLTPGKPLLNIQHPEGTSTAWAAAQKVTFDFKHSLAKLNVTVDTKTNSTAVANPDSNTKVFIRSVTFEGFDTKGALNLNNSEAEKALWYNFDCSNELNNGSEFTIYDGRKDGKEGLTAASKEYAAINPVFVQSTVWGDASAAAGVTAAEVNLFAKTTAAQIEPTDPILVIPNGDKLKVTIEYDVLTKDARLAGMLNDGETHGSVVKNVISRWITKDTASINPGTGNPAEPSESDAIVLENGKTYTIKLHLGLNSVEFDANVTGWVPGSNGGADLPHNNN